MELQAEFFSYLTDGRADGDTVLMARIALNLGHDAEAYPVDLSEITRVGRGGRDRADCGINELWMIDFIRCALMHKVKLWVPSQVERILLLEGVQQAVDKSRAKARKRGARPG